MVTVIAVAAFGGGCTLLPGPDPTDVGHTISGAASTVAIPTYAPSGFHIVGGGFDDQDYWLVLEDAASGSDFTFMAALPVGVVPQNREIVRHHRVVSKSRAMRAQPNHTSLAGVQILGDISDAEAANVEASVVRLSVESFQALIAADPTNNQLARNLDPFSFAPQDPRVQAVASVMGSAAGVYARFDVSVDGTHAGSASGGIWAGFWGAPLDYWRTPDGGVTFIYLAAPEVRNVGLYADGQLVSSGAPSTWPALPTVHVFAATVPPNAKTASVVPDVGATVDFDPATILDD